MSPVWTKKGTSTKHWGAVVFISICIIQKIMPNDSQEHSKLELGQCTSIQKTGLHASTTREGALKYTKILRKYFRGFFFVKVFSSIFMERYLCM